MPLCLALAERAFPSQVMLILLTNTFKTSIPTVALSTNDGIVLVKDDGNLHDP